MRKARPNYSEEPNYAEWCQMALWTVDEALALSLGLDPALITSQEVVQSKEFPSEIRAHYETRRRIVVRANDAGLLAREGHTGMARVMPDQFLSWAKSNGLEIPSRLEDAVNARGGVIANWRVEMRRLNEVVDALERKNKARLARVTETADDKPLTSPERKAVKTIIIAMATAQYSYDSKDGRSSVTSQIVSDAATLGLKIDANTVRKWLAISARSIPTRTPGP